MNAKNILTKETPVRGDPELQDELMKILSQISRLPEEDQENVMRALVRYMNEAVHNTYQTEPEALIAFIRGKDLFRGSEGVIDLGAGPGQLIEKLAALYPEMPMLGLDLSPGFVANFNRKNTLRNVKMDTSLIDWPFANINPDNNISAISVLTLDRLAYPAFLVDNMAKYTKARILATLLPVIPEDDNPSLQENKIVYTRPENRIVPGRDSDEDRDVLLKLLSQKWKTSIQFEEVPYAVTSSGDRQEYKLGVFFTS